MGYGTYSVEDRSVRSIASGYTTKTVDEIFVQNTKRQVNDLMSPKGIDFRVCSDSVNHPNTIPIQLYLDVTGSMGHIPHELIKSGLPELMGNLLTSGVQDASLMFGAIGDHECDSYPLQVGQFESGDAELDSWLEKTYIEGGGGGNDGESYLLAWYFAGNHVQHDCFDVRGEKGFVFTIGDEPNLKSLPSASVQGIMGSTAQAQGNLSEAELYDMASKKNHVYHIFLEHGSRVCNKEWKQLLGENLIILKDKDLLSETIANTILSHSTVNP